MEKKDKHAKWVRHGQYNYRTLKLQVWVRCWEAAWKLQKCTQGKFFSYNV